MKRITQRPKLPKDLTKDMKPIFQSKTAYLSLFTLLSAFIPPLRNYAGENPEVALGFLGVANFVLRLVTRDRVTLI